jgi:hypothetical protein
MGHRKTGECEEMNQVYYPVNGRIDWAERRTAGLAGYYEPRRDVTYRRE